MSELYNPVEVAAAIESMINRWPHYVWVIGKELQTAENEEGIRYFDDLADMLETMNNE